MNSNLKKESVKILKQSQKLKVVNPKKIDTLITTLCRSPKLNTAQRANHRRQIKEEDQQQRQELNRLCQSLKKVDYTRFRLATHQKRVSLSAKLSPTRVQFVTPKQRHSTRRFQKTPYPKGE